MRLKLIIITLTMVPLLLPAAAAAAAGADDDHDVNDDTDDDVCGGHYDVGSDSDDLRGMSHVVWYAAWLTGKRTNLGPAILQQFTLRPALQVCSPLGALRRCLFRVSRLSGLRLSVVFSLGQVVRCRPCRP